MFTGVFPDRAWAFCWVALPKGSSELVAVQRIGSGSSTRSKKLVILAAIALEHSSQIFSHARASFGHIF